MASPSTNTLLTITDRDHGAYLWIVGLLAFFFTSAVTGTRLVLRSRQYGLDDAALAAAQVVAWISLALLAVALVNGLAKSASAVNPVAQRRQAQVHTEPELSSYRQANTSQALRASQSLLIVSLSLSESSMILLIQRIFTLDYKRCKQALTGMHLANGLWLLTSIIAVSAQCSTMHIFGYSYDSQCPGNVSIPSSIFVMLTDRVQATRWTTIYALSALLNIAVVTLPSVYLMFLSMPSADKFAAALAFLFRLPLVPLSALFVTKYASWSNELLVQNDKPSPGLGPGLAIPLVYQLCHLAWSLISASVPSMRRFTRTFSKTPNLTFEHLARNALQLEPRSEFPEKNNATLETLPSEPRSEIYEKTDEAFETSQSEPRSCSYEMDEIFEAYSQAELEAVQSIISTTHSSSSQPGSRRASSEQDNPWERVRPVFLLNNPSPAGMILRPDPVESKTRIYFSESPRPSIDSHFEAEWPSEYGIRRDIYWEVNRSEYDDG